MRLLNWRIPLALFFCATLALAPAIAETRAVGQRPRVEHGPGARAAVPHLGITLYSVAGNSGTVPAGISAMPTKAALRRDANLSGIIATAGRLWPWMTMNPLAGYGAGSHDLRMEARLARVADLGDVKSDISEMTGILATAAPRMYEIYGRFPHLGTLRGK